MMKVSDPIIFGHAVRAFFAGRVRRARRRARRAGASPNNGLASDPDRAREARRRRARGDRGRDRRRPTRPAPTLAMVDSDRGITNLHVPSDVIIDASMPAMIRTSGQMWNAAGDQQDTKAVIPDSSYAALYAETIDFCREHGAFDPATMGTTPNVGLMAQKAEEYGSHDKTFEIAAAGTRARGRRLRATCCSSTTSRRATSGAPARPRTRRSRDWVRLAVERARGDRRAGRVLARRDPRARRRGPREGRARTCAEHDTDGPADRDPAGRARRRASRSSAPSAARTRSRSPATCCATTSPTCSRSSSSARARRCSRSCR